MLENLRIGTAGWGIRKDQGHLFTHAGSHLARYGRRFNAVEINSSFYRPHRPATYERWRDSVPDDFRFSVKMPKAITHVLKLKDAAAPLDAFLAEIGHLGHKLGAVLVQLPPRLAYDPATAGAFFDLLRAGFSGAVVCEPRHPSWFSDKVDERLSAFGIARVAADPAVVPEAGQPGGDLKTVYVRLHGSPKIYYSSYPDDALAALAQRFAAAAAGRQTWCIFDNTALGAAAVNAAALDRMMTNGT